MKYVLMILQVLLGLAFIAAGGSKLFTPVDQLAQQLNWVNYIPAFGVILIGILELAGGLGLILPWLTGIQAGLVRWAAIGLTLTMVGAVITHIAIGDPFSEMIPSIVLGALSAFIAYGRTSLLPLVSTAPASA